MQHRKLAAAWPLNAAPINSPVIVATTSNKKPKVVGVEIMPDGFQLTETSSWKSTAAGRRLRVARVRLDVGYGAVISCIVTLSLDTGKLHPYLAFSGGDAVPASIKRARKLCLIARDAAAPALLADVAAGGSA